MLVQESQAHSSWSRKNKNSELEKKSTVESQWISCTVLVAVSGWWPAGVNVLLMFTVTKIRRVSVRVASCWKVLRFHTMSLPSSPMLHKVWSCTWTWNDQLLSTSMGRGITPSHVCITNENKNKRIVCIYIYSYCHHTIAYSPYLLFLATIASLQQLRTNRDRLQPTSTVSSGSKLILSTSRLCPCRVVTWR